MLWLSSICEVSIDNDKNQSMSLCDYKNKQDFKIGAWMSCAQSQYLKENGVLSFCKYWNG